MRTELDDDARKLTIEIAYCVRCNFLARATWVAQELLHTFADYTKSLALVPAHGGIFEVRVNGGLVASTKTEGGYPEIRLLREKISAYLDDSERATLKRHPKKDEDHE
jgi:selenoprotein W-related protein